MAIIEITSREFRSNQKKFFDLADKGMQIVLKRGRRQAYVLTPLSSEDMFFTPEMLTRIDESIKQASEGKTVKVSGKEELEHLLDSL
ncbi:prevent-host-death protein [Bacteroidales bacterium OttesenSCG-928-B11]|nr:prevent-host-death protein [Bacteroidales bacterium OttesenSCG-928-B11]